MAISGCATPQPQYQFDPGTRLGVLLKDEGTRLCHSHTGLTVFGNFTNTDYEFEFDAHAEMKDAFRRVAAANQQPLLILDEPDYPSRASSYFDFNGWTGAATIKPGMGEKLQTLMDKHRLDVLVLDSGYSREEYEALPDRGNEPWCNVQLQTVVGKHVIVNAKSYFQAIGRQPLAVLGSNAGIGGVLVRDAKPADIKALTDQELEGFVPAAREGVELSVKDFFFELGLGEADFVEGQNSFSF
ncbi:MAG: hypothetical protein AB8G16_07975 [Gammaproteobacteria bacterium]